MLKRKIAETLEMLETAEVMAKAGTPETSEQTYKGDEMERNNATLAMQKADQTQALVNGEAKVKMVKGIVAEYIDEAENQDGSEVWDGMEVAEMLEDLAEWLTAYGSEITEKGDEMETQETKVKMVNAVVAEYFEEAENQDGSEIWDGMTAKEIMEDLAEWLNAYDF